MGRAIVTSSPEPAAPQGAAARGVPDGDAPAPALAAPPDPYGDRLLKLIPGEVISLYLAMVATASGSGQNIPFHYPIVVLLVGAAATWFYLRVAAGVTDKRQLGLSVVAFCIWAFAIGEPFTSQPWYDPSMNLYAGMAVALFTFAAPLMPMSSTTQKMV